MFMKCSVNNISVNLMCVHLLTLGTHFLFYDSQPVSQVAQVIFFLCAVFIEVEEFVYVRRQKSFLYLRN